MVEEHQANDRWNFNSLLAVGGAGLAMMCLIPISVPVAVMLGLNWFVAVSANQTDQQGGYTILTNATEALAMLGGVLLLLSFSSVSSTVIMAALTSYLIVKFLNAAADYAVDHNWLGCIRELVQSVFVDSNSVNQHEAEGVELGMLMHNR